MLVISILSVWWLFSVKPTLNYRIFIRYLHLHLHVYVICSPTGPPTSGFSSGFGFPAQQTLSRFTIIHQAHGRVQGLPIVGGMSMARLSTETNSDLHVYIYKYIYIYTCTYVLMS